VLAREHPRRQRHDDPSLIEPVEFGGLKIATSREKRAWHPVGVAIDHRCSGAERPSCESASASYWPYADV
jgi:hypothetical protein